MPLEIRESIIRLNLLDNASDKDQESAGKRGGIDDEMVQECVDQVLQILKERNER